MAVVALGGLFGGGGRVLGPKVAEALNADYVDRWILTEAAREVGATVEALHQREERPPTRGERFSGMLQRILERSAVTGAGGDPYFGPGAMALLTQEFEELPQPTITRGHEVEDEPYVDAITRVMKELTKRDNVVIVGRGAAQVLRDDRRVLRVGVVANMEARIARVMEIERVDADQAGEILIKRDEARAYYFKRYFDLDNPDHPSRYHLVVNTSEMDHDYSVAFIVQATKDLEEGKFLRTV